MDVPPNIRNADLNDLDTLVDTLSDSFTHDPMFNWVFPRTQLYPFFFHMLVRDVYLPRGIVHTEESGRQSSQGQGIGAELLKRGTTVCDSRGMPAYLESSNPRNVPLYERHGFEIRAQQAIGENGPTVWFMWREPR